MQVEADEQMKKEEVAKKELEKKEKKEAKKMAKKEVKVNQPKVGKNGLTWAEKEAHKKVMDAVREIYQPLFDLVLIMDDRSTWKNGNT